MPLKALKQCLHTGCPNLTRDARCPEHTVVRTYNKAYEQQRGSSSERGYDHRWQKARAVFLRANPLCVSCKSRGIVTASKEVDHIQPHRGDTGLFWDKSNWQTLCKSCHSKKTVRGL